VVQLRVDVEAANARRAFESASRAVDDLGDQLTQAQIDAVRLEDAMDDTAREAARLRAEVQRLGAGASDQLRNDLLEAERAATRARIAFGRADAEVDRLARSLDEAEDEAEELGRALGRLDADAGRSIRGIQRRLAGLSRSMGDAGVDAGRSFGAGMGPGILAGVAAAGPAVGAALNAAILAGLGAGVAGAAAAIAIKNSDVLQAAFSSSFREMATDAKRWAAGFEDELLGVSVTFGRTWDGIAGDLSSAFEKAERFVEPLASGIGRLVESMVGGGGFNKAMDAAGPVIEALSDGLASTGDALDSFFESLGDGGDGAVKAMIYGFAILDSAIRLLGNGLEHAAKAFDVFTKGAENLTGFFSKWLGWVPLLGDYYNFLAEGIAGLNGEANKMSVVIPLAGRAAAGTAGNTERLAIATRDAAKAAQDLSNKLHGLITDEMSASQAAIAWEQAIDDITASFVENGKSIDINTQKGRDNVSTVLQAVAAAEAKRQAAIDLAGGEKASAEAVQAANAAFSAQLGQLRNVLREAGLTESQIDALLKKYEQMANAADIDKRINVYHTTYYREVGGPNYRRVPGAQVALASGTSSAPAGVALVGEEGPELVRFNGGESVFTAQQTARMLSGRRSAGAMGRYSGSASGASGGHWQVSVAPGADSKVAELVKALLNANILQMKVVNGRVKPA
jgi:hypothetical protein